LSQFSQPPSPYASVAASLREQGYHVIPIRPGSKVPGSFSGGEWGNLGAWQKWCDEQPPDFLSDTWEAWPNAGIGLAHGKVVGLDVDTDRADVIRAIKTAVEGSPCCRRGSKGWIGYYQPSLDAHTLGARLRWHDADGAIVVELLMHGTQSVLPPTIHPDTKAPYVWMLGSEALQDVAVSDLPRLPEGIAGIIDHALLPLKVTRAKPRAVTLGDFGLGHASTLSDLEKPAARSLNDRALEPAAINAWWPALNLPKTRQRGNGAWSAVASWRPSGSGRTPSERNPNIGITPNGIRDFGTNVSYTAIDVVMAALSLDFMGAMDWLKPFCRVENGPDISGLHDEPAAPAPDGRIEPKKDPILPPTIPAPEPTGGDLGGTFDVETGAFTPDPAPPTPPAPPPPAAPEPEPEPEPFDAEKWINTPSKFTLSRADQDVFKVALPTKREFEVLVADDPGPFPIQNPGEDCPGLLGQVAVYLDACSTVATEAGGLSVAIPLLGAVMGRGYETPTKLRTNIYIVGLGGSGKGKTSLMGPAKALMAEAGYVAFIGNDRIASGPGLLQMIEAQPQRVCFLDEFGHMLQQMTAVGAGGHIRQILTEFTALYSAASTTYTGTAYASRPSAVIDSPHLCMFGAATPDQFWRAFGSSALEDGSVARFMALPLDDLGMKNPSGEITAELKADMLAIGDAITRHNQTTLLGVSAMEVPITADAEGQRLRLRGAMAGCADYAEMHGIRGAAPILRRVAENATKIALVSAVGRSPFKPLITIDDFDIGHAIARWSARVMIRNIALFVADNETERHVNEVERFIAAGGDKGRPFNKISRKFRNLKAPELRQILASLVEEGSIQGSKPVHVRGGRRGDIFRSLNK